MAIGADGQLLAEAYCNTTETGDRTGHAETNVGRQLSPLLSREALAQATLYSSAEPCVMCAGAIFWAGIGRVVFGIDAVRLRVFRGERAEQRDAALSCRDVFAASPHPIECIGPTMIEEASAPMSASGKCEAPVRAASGQNLHRPARLPFDHCARQSMPEPEIDAPSGALLSRAKQGRERILGAIREAAIAEFSRHGFKGASTKAIAERAGLTKPQLHYYISSKEELYEELLYSVLNGWSGAFISTTTVTTPRRC